MKVLLDAIEVKSIDRAAKFATAVNLLNAALAEQKIFNVDLVDAKYQIGRGVDDAMDVLARPLWVTFRDDRSFLSDDDYMEISCYCATNSAASRLRKLGKYEGKDADLDKYIAALREVAEIAATIKALKQFVVKGRKPSENPVERDLTNTGTCAICGRNVKLTSDGRMVHHGFQRPGVGYILGDCFGVGYLPYEISDEANVAYAIVLSDRLTRHEVRLGCLVREEIASLTKTDRVRVKNARGEYLYEDVETVVRRGERGFDILEENAIHGARQDIDWTKKDIEYNNKKIANWKLCPLPDAV